MRADITCGYCKRVKVSLAIDGDGTTEGERWDQVAQLLPHPWIVRKNSKGNRVAMCGECRAREPVAPNLAPYSVRPRCAKCGHRSTTTRYCGGLDLNKYAMPDVDYQTRTCKKCGYSWNERCRDAK